MPSIRVRTATNPPGDELRWRCSVCRVPRLWGIGQCLLCAAPLTDECVVSLGANFERYAFFHFRRERPLFIRLPCPACGTGDIDVHGEPDGQGGWRPLLADHKCGWHCDVQPFSG